MAKKNKKSGRNNSLEMGVEALEERKLLAGNVVANITGAGDLVVTGDGAGNDISIEIDESGVVTIDANDGENINMGNLDVATVSGDVRINMRGGDDAVYLVGPDGEVAPPIEDVSILTGSGDDEVVLYSVAASGDVNISTGAGNDAAYVKYASVEGNLTISGGGGNDGLYVSDCFVHDLTIRSGAGDDVIEVHESAATGSMLLLSSGGDDEIGVTGSGTGFFSSTPQQLTIRSGSGNDTITMEDSFSKYVSEDEDELPADIVIASGGGNDSLEMVDSFGDLNINLGGGDDSMALVSHDGEGVARGGGGFDSRFIHDATDLDLEVFSFEAIAI